VTRAASFGAFMATSGRNQWQSLAAIARCLFYKQTTHRGYETGTSGWTRAGTRGHGRHDLRARFAGKT
jgi:hypothetical protein